jgi:hypothetical protein
MSFYSPPEAPVPVDPNAPPKVPSKFSLNFKVGLTAADLRRIVWTAVFAFVGVFTPLAAGLAGFHNFSDAKAAALALLPAGLAAALSAVKNGILADTSVAK